MKLSRWNKDETIWRIDSAVQDLNIQQIKYNLVKESNTSIHVA